MNTIPRALEYKSDKPNGESKDIEVKTLGGIEIKDEEKGEVEAIIATLDVMDRDGDIIRADAIKSGAKVKMSAYGHDAMWGEMPVGKGAITIKGDKAVFSGKVFVETARGREVFTVLKAMGADQEWSFGFRVTGWEAPKEDDRKKGVYRVLTKLEPFEVSPVIRGAGVGTRTVNVKDDKPDDPTPTAEEVEAKRTADEAVEKARVDQEAADIAAAATRAAEEKAVADKAALELKAMTEKAVEDFRRIQRTHKRLGLVA